MNILEILFIPGQKRVVGRPGWPLWARRWPPGARWLLPAAACREPVTEAHNCFGRNKHLVIQNYSEQNIEVVDSFENQVCDLLK